MTWNWSQLAFRDGKNNDRRHRKRYCEHSRLKRFRLNRFNKINYYRCSVVYATRPTPNAHYIEGYELLSCRCYSAIIELLLYR